MLCTVVEIEKETTLFQVWRKLSSFTEGAMLTQRKSSPCPVNTLYPHPLTPVHTHKMADLYAYDNVVVTRLLEDNVKHLLSEEVKRSVSEVLITKLEQWRKSDRGVEVLNNVCLDVEPQLKVMPFSLVRQIQEQLKITPQRLCKHALLETVDHSQFVTL